MGDTLVFQIRQLLVGAVSAHDRDQTVAGESGFLASGGERDRTGEVYGEAGRAGREARYVQPPRPHGFDLGRIRLHRVVDDALAGALGEVVGEWLEDVLVEGGVFHRRVGEDQRRWIAPVLRVFRHVGDKIAVFVAVARVELAAVLAVVGVHHVAMCDKQTERSAETDSTKPARRREHRNSSAEWVAAVSVLALSSLIQRRPPHTCRQGAALVRAPWFAQRVVTKLCRKAASSQ